MKGEHKTDRLSPNSEVIVGNLVEDEGVVIDVEPKGHNAKETDTNVF